jgi:hypothetical protein
MPPSNLTHASSRAITRPPCPKCGATMMLARIEPIRRATICAPSSAQPAIIRKARWCISEVLARIPERPS